MAIKNYNVPPYYDDFDQTKNYLRVLFRPGYAVQARELTQLQTSIQAQIDRFGSHVFKEGSQVIGGEVTIDTKYAYIKLESSVTVGMTTYSADEQVALAVGRTITGAVTGITATVIEAVQSTASDPTTLYVKYTGVDTILNKYHEFGAAEQLSFSPEGGGTRYLQVGAASTIPLGYGTKLSLNEGVFFTKGCFAYTPAASVIMAKYNNRPSGRVVYTVTESVVTQTEDPTLTDNALGTPNAAAPGAHRYAISLDLSVQKYDLTARSETNIIQVAVIKNGKIISQAHSEYAQLNDTLAQRTYEESGNYTVKPFQINLREFYNDGTNGGLYTTAQIREQYPTLASDTAAVNYGKARLAVGVEPSVAYVKGYRVELIDTQYVEVEKARDEGYINAASTIAQLGGYVNITLSGTCGLPDITNFSTLKLLSDASKSVTFQDSGDTVTLTTHGLSNGDTVSFSSITSTTGISANTTYYVVNAATDTFKLATSSGGSAIALTNDGSGTMQIIIGSARARSLEYSGSGNVYRLYLFDVNMNAGKYFSQSTYVYQYTGSGPTFYAAIPGTAGTAAINDVGNNTLVYKLPADAIQTLRTKDGLIDTLYYVKRKYDNRQTDGSSVVTISAAADEIFESSQVSDWTAVTAAGVKATPASVVIGSGGTSVTLTFTTLANTYMYIIGPSRRNLREKIKKLTTGFIQLTSPNTTPGNYDALGVTDLFKITGIYMSASSGVDAKGPGDSGGPDTEISDRYIIDNGQRDNFYDVARIQLKAGAVIPTGRVKVEYQYFAHQPGDYFTVDSYTGIDYEEIPSFPSSRGVIQLRDAIDFRPTKDTTGANFTGTSASTVNMIKPGSVITCDIQYYLPRVDKLYVDKLGNFNTVKGVSRFNPQPPDDPNDAMVLYVLKLGAYTFGPEHVVPIMLDNKRYTMRDIGKLEKRIANVEYYTALSLLERDTAGLQIFDNSNKARYKNGFVVDSFYGHGIGAVTNPDYKCSVDKNSGTLRPAFYQDNVKLLVDLTKSSNVRKTGDLLTLDYIQVNAIEQPYASTSEYLNPFNFHSSIGQLHMSPSTDEWRETLRKPDVIVDQNNSYSTYQYKDDNDAGQTVWNDWQTTWSGTEKTDEVTKSNDPVWDPEKFGYVTTSTTSLNLRTTQNQTRTGVRTSYVPSIQTQSTGDRVVEMNVVPYMRSRKIYFKAIGLKPDTRLYAFFDGINVDNYVRLESSFLDYTTRTDSANYLDASSHPDGAIALYSDANGVVIGSFVIPNTPTLKFKTGQRTFRLTSSSSNSLTAVSTSAESTYSANGMQDVVQNTLITTRSVNVVRTTVTDNRALVSNATSSSTSSSIKKPPFEFAWYVNPVVGGALNPTNQKPADNTTVITGASTAASYDKGGTLNPINFTVAEPEGGFPTVIAGQPATTTTEAAAKTIAWTPVDAQPPAIDIRSWPDQAALTGDTPTITTVNQTEVNNLQPWDDPALTLRWEEV